MWLSKRIMQEQPEPDSATLGTVSIGGAEAAVVTDTEKRQAKLITPGGYCWKPSAADNVLIVKGNELYLTGQLMHGADELGEGEVRVYSLGASLTLRNDGRIVLNGDVELAGSMEIMGDVLVRGDLTVLGRITGVMA